MYTLRYFHLKIHRNFFSYSDIQDIHFRSTLVLYLVRCYSGRDFMISLTRKFLLGHWNITWRNWKEHFLNKCLFIIFERNFSWSIHLCLETLISLLSLLRWYFDRYITRIIPSICFIDIIHSLSGNILQYLKSSCLYIVLKCLSVLFTYLCSWFSVISAKNIT